MIFNTQGSNGGFVAESISNITSLHRSFTYDAQDIRRLDATGGTVSVLTVALLPDVTRRLDVCTTQTVERDLGTYTTT